MVHAVLVEPRRPLLKVLARPHTPRDGVPALLRLGLFGHIAHLDDQILRLVHEHLGEQLVVAREMVEMRQRLEGENFGVEVVGFAERKAGEFEVVDALEGAGHGL